MRTYRLLFTRPPLFSVSSPILSPIQALLSETEFWKWCFQSNLFRSHRASVRFTGTQRDTTFGIYPEKLDDGERSLFYCCGVFF